MGAQKPPFLCNMPRLGKRRAPQATCLKLDRHRHQITQRVPRPPRLCAPKDVAKRKPGSPEGRIALLHAVAHIELNAVDLHWDIIVRFSKTRLPTGFFDDWVQAASEESKHFNLICDCLERSRPFKTAKNSNKHRISAPKSALTAETNTASQRQG